MKTLLATLLALSLAACSRVPHKDAPAGLSKPADVGPAQTR